MRAAGQLDMFADLVPGQTPNVETPAARATDPETSHAAAEDITASGVRQEQQARALAAVRAFPGMTSHELAAAARIDRYELARRLPEVRAAGLIHNTPDHARPADPVTGRLWPAKRTCAESGRPAMTWEPGPEPLRN